MHKIFSNVLVEISKDGLQGYMTLLHDKPNDNDTNERNEREGIDKIIKEVKSILKVGVNEEKVRDLLIKKLYNVRNCIAEGVIPVDGKDGYIKYNFDLEKKVAPKVLKDGTVDYRELDMINNVTTGEVLAEIYSPKEGKDGLKVTGEPIPYKKGKQPNINYGKNVRLLDNKKALIAEKDGLVTLINGKIVVLDIFEVENVDNNVGNVYFNGTVKIGGNVLNNFKVIADGDVQVNGIVEGGYIENLGDVVVKRGIQGYNKLVVKTKGNISTRFIENAMIISERGVLAEAIMHSQVSCRDNINLIGKRGLIVGGICRAGGEISAKTVGSTMATGTVLEVGVDPEIKDKSVELINNIDQMKENLDKIYKTLNLLDRLKKANKLDKKKVEMYKKLIRTRKSLQANLEKLMREKHLTDKIIEEVSKGCIKISDVVYPGVKIIIGNSSMIVKDEIRNCVFYRDDGEIKIGTYRE